ncbi:hypothetical protein NPIL_547191 [Nephila pilipes]|uniref:Uncharacterized protein n=1 Tax=Nephila pilipes TaxID=299642 RepID=A0A8X6MEG8_NEPPI|nr:hypothetical protein NPIL_547191 [Nephila pilipes]
MGMAKYIPDFIETSDHVRLQKLYLRMPTHIKSYPQLTVILNGLFITPLEVEKNKKLSREQNICGKEKMLLAVANDPISALHSFRIFSLLVEN